MELKSVRRFFHVEIEAHGANMRAKTVRTTPRYLEYSRQKSEKVYRKMLVVSYRNPTTNLMNNQKIAFWDIPKANQELLDEYEYKKAIFQQMLYKRLSYELEEDENKNNKNTPKAAAAEQVEQTLTEYQRGILKYLREGVKKQKDIAEMLKEDGYNSDPNKVSKNIKWMRKKGVVIINK